MDNGSNDYQGIYNIENGITSHDHGVKGGNLMAGKNGSRTPQTMSSSLLRKKSDPILMSKVRFQMLRDFLTNLQEVILGTKLAILFPAIPLAIAADFYHFGRVSTIYTSVNIKFYQIADK